MFAYKENKILAKKSLWNALYFYGELEYLAGCFSITNKSTRSKRYTKMAQIMRNAIEKKFETHGV